MRTTNYNYTKQNRSRLAGVKLLTLLCVSSALSLWAVTCWTTTTAPCTSSTTCRTTSPNCGPALFYDGVVTNVPNMGAWTSSASGYWSSPTTNADCVYDCTMTGVDCRNQTLTVSQTNSIPVPDTGAAGTTNCPGNPG
jgi:hypothetical protein